MDDPGEERGAGATPAPDATPRVRLGQEEERFGFEPQTLKDYVATQILHLFRHSLYCTLGFAAFLIVVDVIFIWTGTVKPGERLMTEAVIMTFVGATVVQVGAAIGAIVLSIFKSEPGAGAADPDRDKS
jgi:hypothetical protein